MKQEIDSFKKQAELEAIKETASLSDTSIAPQLMELGKYWGIIRLALQFAMLFTGKKADAKIREVIAWGDGVFGE